MEAPVQMTMFTDYDVVERTYRGWVFKVIFDATKGVYVARFETLPHWWDWVYEENPDKSAENVVRVAQFNSAREATVAVKAAMDRLKERQAAVGIAA